VVVSTIEHLMAALMGCNVDNVLIEVDGTEIPIVDGSAAPYVDLLTEAGGREQNAPRRYVRVTRPFVVKEGDAYIQAFPSQRMQIHYIIDFPHPLVGRQEMKWTFDPAGFRREIALARTFGFLKDVQRLQRMGFALGGSLSNAVVFNEDGLLNREGFRFPMSAFGTRFWTSSATLPSPGSYWSGDSKPIRRDIPCTTASSGSS